MEEVVVTDEPVLGDLDELALPDLPDSVWMRLLANALDPDAARVDEILIPVDLPTDDAGASSDDDAPGWAELEDSDVPPDTGDTDHTDDPSFGGHHDPSFDPHGGAPEPGADAPHTWHAAADDPPWHHTDDAS